MRKKEKNQFYVERFTIRENDSLFWDLWYRHVQFYCDVMWRWGRWHRHRIRRAWTHPNRDGEFFPQSDSPICRLVWYKNKNITENTSIIEQYINLKSLLILEILIYQCGCHDILWEMCVFFLWEDSRQLNLPSFVYNLLWCVSNKVQLSCTVVASDLSYIAGNKWHFVMCHIRYYNKIQ